MRLDDLHLWFLANPAAPRYVGALKLGNWGQIPISSGCAGHARHRCFSWCPNIDRGRNCKHCAAIEKFTAWAGGRGRTVVSDAKLNKTIVDLGNIFVILTSDGLHNRLLQ